ncbi:LETM1 domain-containing protein 1-like [Amphibalanus amphitrite]|uniref:LETM1 domain-containing protein 1-like n=1 Tax=Amphibalanus amphitrite TaxID=1232801 RepID=UPI001C91E9BF|nr:LETM1 domain-containing protein 1-like [Amphibalanus amphitrite]XP_043203180.1 LETM1 domain-containing protein 1-like [Amphibalanus amphitrite]
MYHLSSRTVLSRLVAGLHYPSAHHGNLLSSHAGKRCLQTGLGHTAAPEGRRPVTRLQKYVFGRYVEYLQRFQRALENEFPTAFRLYRVFSVGVKDFARDVKSFALLARKVHGLGLRSLSRRELELYFQMPRDMRAVAPVLLVAALPLAQNVVFPLAYLFPRQLLCRHFWSLQQRSDFALYEHKRRLAHHLSAFRHLQARRHLVTPESARLSLKHVFTLLGSGQVPCSADILALRPIFEGGPFSLERLSAVQVRRLLKLHGLGVLTVLRRRRLREHGELLRHMDRAMLAEGVTAMSQEELYYACFLRGLNPQNLPHEQLAWWLSEWATVSSSIEPAAVSLLLHCPLLLGYNQPTNWQLRY